jgi:hypothetical protein
MRTTSLILFWLFFLLLTLPSCDKAGSKESLNQISQQKLLKDSKKPLSISNISIEKFSKQKQTTPLSNKCDYLITFKVSNLTNDKIYTVTYPDSSCVYIGVESWQKGMLNGTAHYNTPFSNSIYRKIYFNSNPVRLYYPFKFDPSADSTFYFVTFMNEANDSTRISIPIKFKIISSETGPEIINWKR